MGTRTPFCPRYLLQEDDLSDECRSLLQNLPRELGGIGSHVYQYQGFWLPPRHLQGLLVCREHFQARDTDIMLVTSPKSGTTWLKAMAFALLNRSRYLDHHRDHPLLTNNPQDLIPLLEHDTFGFGELPDLSTLPDPRIFATHVPVGVLASYGHVSHSSCKIVYMCRDPKDVFVSLWHFCNKLRPKGLVANDLQVMFDRFCGGSSVYGPYWDHVIGYWEESLKNPNKVLFLKYEEIKEQPAGQLRNLAGFLGCPFSPEEEDKGTVDEIVKLCSFDHLSNLEVNKTGKSGVGMANESFFRKGKVGGWEEVLTPEMANKLDRITIEKMGGCGFKF